MQLSRREFLGSSVIVGVSGLVGAKLGPEMVKTSSTGNVFCRSCGMPCNEEVRSATYRCSVCGWRITNYALESESKEAA